MSMMFVSIKCPKKHPESGWGDAKRFSISWVVKKLQDDTFYSFLQEHEWSLSGGEVAG